MESLKELYRIGPGPSSSHTLAVRNACLYYINRYGNDETTVVELYGSLSLTGKGHGTDRVIENTFSKKRVDVRFMNQYIEGHPNTMVFYREKDTGRYDEMTIYSIGGGAIAVEGEPSAVDVNVYPQKTMGEISLFCRANHMSLADYVFYYEPDIKPHLNEVLSQMLQVTATGLTQEGTLPGPLKLEKVAKKIYRRAMDCEDEKIKKDLTITAYAYAAMEENNCGHMVVTAPTLGSCGVVSAIINYYYQQGVSRERLINALAVGGVFGNVVKTNATISGAVGGCQAEIGTACAMAAAMAAYLESLSAHQIEYAAEVAMEHNLGLTCDPVGGYVQVPCIERNGVAALRALDCALYAKYIATIRANRVTFDKVVQVMNYTGRKLAMELRETSLGGLAVVLNTDKIGENADAEI